jgi:hypothetical protein
MSSACAYVFAQAFNWESHKKNWYRDCIGKVSDWAKQGFTSIWLPPPSDSVSPQVRIQLLLLGLCVMILHCGHQSRAGLLVLSCRSAIQAQSTLRRSYSVCLHFIRACLLL